MALDSARSSRESGSTGNDGSTVGSQQPSALFMNQELFFLASLFLVELSVAGILIAMHMKGERIFIVFLSSRPGVVFLCAGVTLLLGGVAVVRRYLENRQAPSRQFRLIVTMNLVTALLILLMGEVLVRVSARDSLEGEVLGKKELVPKNWNAVMLRNRQLLDEAGARLTYLVHDDRLG